MQSFKAIVTMLICAGLLGACGLKGPLYLPESETVAKPAEEPKSTSPVEAEDEKETKKD